MSVVQLTDAGCGVNFLKHCVTVTYNGRIVLEGARDITNKLWIVRLADEKPPSGPVSPSNMMFESANHVTTDQWQNMRENGSNFGQNGQFLQNVALVPNDQIMPNITRTSTKPELVTYHYQLLGSPPSIVSNVGTITLSRQSTNVSRNEQEFDQQTSSTSYSNLQGVYGQKTDQPKFNKK